MKENNTARHATAVRVKADKWTAVCENETRPARLISPHVYTEMQNRKLRYNKTQTRITVVD